MYPPPPYLPPTYEYGPGYPDGIHMNEQMLQYGHSVRHGGRMSSGGTWSPAELELIAGKQMPGRHHNGQYVDRHQGAPPRSFIYPPLSVDHLAYGPPAQTPMSMHYPAFNGSLPMPYQGPFYAPDLLSSTGHPSPGSNLSHLPRHSRASSPSSSQGITRSGPPIKPKRSGHAIWVGNVAPSAHICDLKELFSDGFKQVIESVYLMRKTNCAFVNYRSDKVCREATAKFNQSLLGTPPQRVLCRLRRDSASDAGTLGAEEDKENRPMDRSRNGSTRETEEPTPASEELDAHIADAMTSKRELKTRYFIMKSLQKQDLDRSVITSTWKTQPHNQSVLHQAFNSAETVYLIFSANGTGGYYGVAIMLSSPLDSNSSPEIQAQDENDSVDVTITPETRTAPRGRVIDDPARQILFWEAIQEEQHISTNSDQISTALPVSRPFKIRWLHQTTLEFDRVRGIKNPWNDRKDVKVARDGTELETSVGERLLALFEEQMAKNRWPEPKAVDPAKTENTP